MARWEKLLAQMLSDSKPITYTYADAVVVLAALGYELAPHGGGSHRKWRRAVGDGNVSYVGLVEKGYGPLKPYLIREMLREIRRVGLIPPDLEK